MRAFVAAALAAGLLAACGGDEGNGITQLAKQPGAVAADALSAQLIPSDDLPPDGTRSLFDHLIAANGQIPYPFPKLVELIRKNEAGDIAYLRSQGMVIEENINAEPFRKLVAEPIKQLFAEKHGTQLIDAIESTVGDDDEFSFIGTNAFTAAGQIRVQASGKNVVMYFNTDLPGQAVQGAEDQLIGADPAPRAPHAVARAPALQRKNRHQLEQDGRDHRAQCPHEQRRHHDDESQHADHRPRQQS